MITMEDWKSPKAYINGLFSVGPNIPFMLIFALSHAIEDVHLACTNNLLIYFLATPAASLFHLPYKTLENRKTKNGSEYLDLPALTKPIYTRLHSRRVQGRRRRRGREREERF